MHVNSHYMSRAHYVTRHCGILQYIRLANLRQRSKTALSCIPVVNSVNRRSSSKIRGSQRGL